MYKSIFINEVSSSWILNILGSDICRVLNQLGCKCRKGKFEDYSGEDISLHMWWRHAQPYKEAKINSVFITHIDDKVKEFDLLALKDVFDIFICMSPEDAKFLGELGFDEKKVFGINLPTRNTYIKPVSIGIFSNCYPSMKTKNEDWLLDYCSNNPISQLADYCFVGHGWSEVVNKLSEYGCSFQWHCVDRKLPSEYLYQQLKLTNLDYYLYMGMDGGAMGTYDAYAMGATLVVSDDGYHKGIPDVNYSFTTKEAFFETMNSILSKQERKISFFLKNNVDNYVKTLLFIYHNGKYPDDMLCNLPVINYSVKDKRRKNYYTLTFERIRQPLISSFIKWKNRRKKEHHEENKN